MFEMTELDPCPHPLSLSPSFLPTAVGTSDIVYVFFRWQFFSSRNLI